jgi:hypothetical protein
MTIPGSYTLNATKCRFYEEFVTAVIGMASHRISRQAMRGVVEVPSPFCFTMESRHSGLAISFDVYPAIYAFSQNSFPNEITIQVYLSCCSPDATLTQTPVQRLYALFFEHAFLSYYSKIESELKSKFGNQMKLWADDAAFAWIIRNGFGHGRKINVNDPLVIGRWRGKILNSKNLNSSILYNHISQADLVILMMDLDCVNPN